ncbi:MAG TPA: M20/M25/M40 family metallo-hydrolase [Candidatus Saccharimonadales bacterium]|nr:M20/M25/M40 family metallo-hydrolase [Candidatus Saccharimonadales bacterium]
MKELLSELSSAWGPSGEEGQVAALVRRRVRGHVDTVAADVLGNLVARRRGKGARVMVAAHMDEIGVVVSHVDPRGFVRFSNVGGVMANLLAAQRVRLKSGRVGVVMEEERGNKEDQKLDRMYADFGFESAAEAARHVRVGDVACFDREPVVQGHRFVGKALDDRVACAVLIEAARRLKRTPNDVSLVFTVQEEVGCRGAQPAAFALDPEVALAVDVTLTGDVPECRPMAVSLGAGPGIKVKDGGHIGHPRVRELLLRLARRLRLKHQLEVLALERASTDASVIHKVRAGVPSGCVSIPCRYVHSVSEMVDLRDVEGAVRLVVAFLETDLRKAGF